MKKNYKKGSLRWIIYIVIGIALASFYFGFSVQDVVENEQMQSNFSYIQTHINDFYQEHLAEKINYFWNDVVVNLFWDSFVDNMERVKNGEPTNIELLAPSIEISDKI